MSDDGSTKTSLSKLITRESGMLESNVTADGLPKLTFKSMYLFVASVTVTLVSSVCLSSPVSVSKSTLIRLASFCFYSSV